MNTGSILAIACLAFVLVIFCTKSTNGEGGVAVGTVLDVNALARKGKKPKDPKPSTNECQKPKKTCIPKSGNQPKNCPEALCRYTPKYGVEVNYPYSVFPSLSYNPFQQFLLKRKIVNLGGFSKSFEAKTCRFLDKACDCKKCKCEEMAERKICRPKFRTETFITYVWDTYYYEPFGRYFPFAGKFPFFGGGSPFGGLPHSSGNPFTPYSPNIFGSLFGFGRSDRSGEQAQSRHYTGQDQYTHGTQDYYGQGQQYDQGQQYGQGQQYVQGHYDQVQQPSYYDQGHYPQNPDPYGAHQGGYQSSPFDFLSGGSGFNPILAYLFFGKDKSSSFSSFFELDYRGVNYQFSKHPKVRLVLLKVQVPDGCDCQ